MSLFNLHTKLNKFLFWNRWWTWWQDWEKDIPTARLQEKFCQGLLNRQALNNPWLLFCHLTKACYMTAWQNNNNKESLIHTPYATCNQSLYKDSINFLCWPLYIVQRSSSFGWVETDPSFVFVLLTCSWLSRKQLWNYSDWASTTNNWKSSFRKQLYSHKISTTLAPGRKHTVVDVEIEEIR